MLKVALTGGIASGKSTVAALLRQTGLPVLDSDAVARAVVAPGQPAWQELRQAFGQDFFAPDGSLDRAALARHVFTQPAARQRLHDIIHPWITREVQSWLHNLEAQGTPLAVVEVPLLFELGLETHYDVIVVVTADPATQRQRLQQRDNRPDAEVEGILTAQMPRSTKAARAHLGVDNAGSLDDTRRQVKKILAALRKHLDKPHKKVYRGA